MKRLAQFTRFIKKLWAQDEGVPPYPLTYDEWDFVQEGCQETEIEIALKQELAQVPLIELAGGRGLTWQ